MQVIPKQVILLVSFMFFLSISLILESDICESKTKNTITVLKLETTNLSSKEASRVSNIIKNEVAKYGNTIKTSSSAGANKIVSGLISRMNKVYIITLTVKDTKNGKTKQTTKNLKGSFNNFLNRTVKSAINAVLP